MAFIIYLEKNSCALPGKRIAKQATPETTAERQAG